MNRRLLMFNGLVLYSLSLSACLNLPQGANSANATENSAAEGAFLDSRESDAIYIGDRRELFVDEYFVESMSKVRFKLHHPTALPQAKSPLPVRHMMTVIKDRGVYRAWYRAMDPGYTGETHTGHPGESVFYAESTDGHEWRFPNLGLHEIDGSMENNAVLARNPPFLTNFMPFLDTRPKVDPAERYKAVAGYPGPGDKRGVSEPGMGLYGFVSPDGIQWTQQEEIIPYRPEWRHAFDSPNVAFWSEAEQQYVCYFRTWTPSDRLRTIARTTSPDFINWSDPVEMEPNLKGEHLYTNMTHPYVRAPHIYIAFPTRFVPTKHDSAEHVHPNRTDVLFMSTRAGSTHYDRPFTEAFIRPGLDPKQWTNRANFTAQNVIQTSPTELSIYHRSGQRYVIRPDGFISIHAGSSSGSLTTKPIVFEGENLDLNYSTSAKGYVTIEFLDENGQVLASSQPMIGDAIDGEVRWSGRGDVSEFSGRPVRLRFKLQEADVYAFRFN